MVFMFIDLGQTSNPSLAWKRDVFKINDDDDDDAQDVQTISIHALPQQPQLPHTEHPEGCTNLHCTLYVLTSELIFPTQYAKFEIIFIIYAI